MNNAFFITPVEPWSSFGGTATVSRNLISLFREAFDLQVYCLRANEPGAYPREMHDAVALSGPVPNWLRRLKFFLDVREGAFAHRQFHRRLVRKHLAQQLASEKPGLVILDHIFSGWILDVLPDAARVIYIAHDDMVAYADSLLQLQPDILNRTRFRNLRTQYRRLQGRILERADLVLTMTKEDAARLHATSSGQVDVAPLFFEFETAPEPDRGDFRYLLITGSFDTWEKQLGLERFLTTIFPALTSRIPVMRLVVAGRIPARFGRRISELSGSVRIVDGPSTPEMDALIKEASAAAVLDLQASGLKIKTIQLACAGLPIVSWAPGLEGTGLVDGQSCLLARSVGEFSEHLARLYHDAELRRQLGSRARATVRGRFSKGAARCKVEEILRGGV